MLPFENLSGAPEQEYLVEGIITARVRPILLHLQNVTEPSVSMNGSDPVLFVALEAPASLTRWTYDCRRAWAGVWRPDIPPALGGMGPLSAPLDPRICISQLEHVCALQPPISTRFLEVRQCREQQLLYLVPGARRELDAFAMRLAAAGFAMQPNPFERLHHFGVAFFEPDADASMRHALATCQVPRDAYRFAFVQLYQVTDAAIRSLWRGRLRGVTSRCV